MSKSGDRGLDPVEPPDSSRPSTTTFRRASQLEIRSRRRNGATTKIARRRFRRLDHCARARVESRADRREARSVRSNEASKLIDSATEELITFAQAADDLPRRRRGRKTHVSTLYRWSAAGCRGIRLETIQVGGSCCTSRDALQRFFERLTLARSEAGDANADRPMPDRRSAVQRQRDSERAAETLKRLGA